MSDFTVIIKGPTGIILAAEIDATLRHVRSLALDDAALKPLLIVTSVMAGMVEGECLKAQSSKLKVESVKEVQP